MSIDIPLQLNDQHGRSIVEETLSRPRVSASRFLGLVAPGQKVESLPRPTMLDIGQEQPSSLFYQALHRAYAEHHAFKIRPEVLMYLIVSVVAETVRKNPEAYRELFTTIPDKETIQVRHDGLVSGDPGSPWHEAIGLFYPALRERVSDRIMDCMMPELSTHTPETRVASLVAFMDAASPFYDYRVMTRCGTPRIVLGGTPEDYRRLVDASAALADRFSDRLGPYFAGVLSVLRILASEAKTVSEGGNPDPMFWGQIYKHHNQSGGPSYSGWAGVFVGYVRIDGRGPAQTVLRDKLGPWAPDPRVNDRWNGDVPSGFEPSHVSTVPFVWDYLGTDIPMSFAGGILGLDEEDGAITPQLSYAVLNRTA